LPKSGRCPHRAAQPPGASDTLATHFTLLRPFDFRPFDLSTFDFPYVTIALTTLPCTSVRRKSRPWNR
jgi:hypothetical protein